MHGLPVRALREGELALPEHPGVRALRHPAESRVLFGGETLLHRSVRLYRGGLHLRPPAGEGEGGGQPEPEESREQGQRGGVQGEEGVREQTVGLWMSVGQLIHFLWVIISPQLTFEAI